LIERFADDAGKKGGEFYTPRRVVQLIVELLQPKETDRICDPTVGSGGMLIECAKYVERHGGDPRKLTLHGQENNLGTWAICKMNMLLHGLPDARIEKGDTIRNPRLLKDGVLEVYDKVIANPPFSLDDWGREFAETDPHGRFRYGIPPKTKGDLAFIQHMIATAGVRGRVAVVMPHGVLFRGAAEGDIRAGLVKEDLLEAVIGLGPNLFYGAGIPTAILVFNRAKAADRRGKVLFVHGAEQMAPGTTQQNTLSDENIATLLRAFKDFVDKPRLAKVVTVEQLEKDGFNCNITNYVDLSENVDQPDVESTLRGLRAAIDARAQAERRMEQHLRELGYGKK
jgi:type I restriction enzyme M protein